jgi:predicted KAP-like P-loop ATPase
VDIVIENADDLEFIKRSFRQALKTKRRDGSTNASLLLEELDVHAKDFPEEKSEPFLTALFSLGDELDVPEDRPRGLLSLAGNRLRMHWLIRGLTLDRFSLEQRSAIFYRACEHAALGWLVNFATSAYNDHYPNSESAEQVSEDRCLVDRSTLDSLLDITLLRLRAAANDGSLQEHPDLAPALFAWRDFANDDGREVQQATANIMADDHGVACLARAFTTDVWMHASGDMVDRRKKRANTKNLSSVLDTREFRRRLEELEAQSDISDKDREAACEFLLDWRRQDEGRDDF